MVFSMYLYKDWAISLYFAILLGLLWVQGPVAQLVERSYGIAEARGSKPRRSTTSLSRVLESFAVHAQA